MKCPVCDEALVKQVVGPVELDVCMQGCRGIWFDAHEMKKFDEPHEPAEPITLNFKTSQPSSPNPIKRLNCPKCKNIVMIRRFSSVKRKVEVDECGNCAGIWLDAGELGQIRDEFKTEKDRVQAAEDCFTEMFGARLDQQRSQTQEQLHKAQRIANALRFISPSYYLPGKQKGGAF